jgi:hypothetical protein
MRSAVSSGEKENQANANVVRASVRSCVRSSHGIPEVSNARWRRKSGVRFCTFLVSACVDMLVESGWKIGVAKNVSIKILSPARKTHTNARVRRKWRDLRQ